MKWFYLIFCITALDAHGVELKNEVVLDYYSYFEKEQEKINSRRLVQLKSSVEEALSDNLSGFIQVEAKKDFSDSRYDDFRLYEGYVDIRLPAMDLRIGKHQSIWGKTDFFNPTDTLTPTDYTDFYDTEDRRQPIELAQGRVFFNSSELELLVQFGFEASYLPKSRSRWLPDLSELTNGDGLPINEHIGPEPDETVSTIGLKHSFFLPNFDFSLSYLHGWHPVSNADVIFTADTLEVDYYYYKRHQLGADFATNIDQVGIRGEIAYTRVTEDSNGNDREGGYIQYAIGVDKTFTSLFLGKDFYINLELLGDENIHSDTFERISLFDAFDLATGLMLEVSEGYTWRFSLETIFNLEDKDYRIRSKLVYSPLDGLDIDLICDFGGGDDRTLYGMYENNDRFQMRVTYSF